MTHCCIIGVWLVRSSKGFITVRVKASEAGGYDSVILHFSHDPILNGCSVMAALRHIVA